MLLLEQPWMSFYTPAHAARGAGDPVASHAAAEPAPALIRGRAGRGRARLPVAIVVRWVNARLAVPTVADVSIAAGTQRRRLAADALACVHQRRDEGRLVVDAPVAVGTPEAGITANIIARVTSGAEPPLLWRPPCGLHVGDRRAARADRRVARGDRRVPGGDRGDTVGQVGRARVAAGRHGAEGSRADISIAVRGRQAGRRGFRESHQIRGETVALRRRRGERAGKGRGVGVPLELAALGGRGGLRQGRLIGGCLVNVLRRAVLELGCARRDGCGAGLGRGGACIDGAGERLLALAGLRVGGGEGLGGGGGVSGGGGGGGRVICLCFRKRAIGASEN
eukprot:COSAG06_NODE_4325_length_4365_cov_2.112518_1_plen_338_part_00